MITERRNNLFHVCALIEYISRETKNHRGVVAGCIGVNGIRKLLQDAPVNHCLTFEQVSVETIEAYNIPNGCYDTISSCTYRIPSFIDIGKIYAYLTEDLASAKTDDAEIIMSLFTSFLSDAISDFRTGIYYENLSYLLESFLAGRLLDADIA